ncbi:putative phosphoinositide phospholipase C, Phosphatidylinositol diacylglycerol-lyase [Helianthus annuus]|uniref:Phosphoinositide phospholipase C, Phosphatidylinositol diacylglycerol-lyase n=1 Tax=Helianthus annuus TaxID=4232 RepID=A0A251S904_HELAN|nr:uncharacterized protein LOC110911561 [Helianthus annuus]KAF5764398.1 putative phosphoinositide phospholipase C, Phosphatidylinositol diacylglycerol-lyase [Helianthus annuus]KAJ0451083.1 putative phosphoinositide phospholipase C, Phosphatidylinositol diacylglycerol-lyase [Helianthus annuus]KAJ0455479.1 putative phosphoinositide phospholipase C, Phosphatidylinositol diacylglycerol-lyase [Helianthus annuus]KAJ0472945.1 putative phosphoinositide phospholipase C, Phosphatidylinositol diacylglycer
MGVPLSVQRQLTTLRKLEESTGSNFPGSDHHPTDRKNWISGLNPEKIHLNQIVWPGTHNSATNQIGFFITRPFGECQSRSIYEQLVLGTRLLDVRVNENRNVCHGPLVTYGVDVVINNVKKFISETESEIIILEVRTEFGHSDPPEFENYLKQQLGEYLIHQDDKVFDKTVAEILPKRIICIWKPRNSDPPKLGSPIWSSGYLKDNWINTNFPETKFEGNMKNLSQQPPVSSRKYFYRVENTLTPQGLQGVDIVTNWFHWCKRLFIAQCFLKNIADRLQVFSTDFIDEDFVDACVGLTWARIEGKA